MVNHPRFRNIVQLQVQLPKTKRTFSFIFEKFDSSHICFHGLLSRGECEILSLMSLYADGYFDLNSMIPKLL